MRNTFRSVIAIWLSMTLVHAQSADEVKTEFHIRYVAGGSVYIDGGRNAGLTAGMRLNIALPPSPSSEAAQQQNAVAASAELKILSVAENSAMCEVLSASRDLVVGDVVTLGHEDAAALVTRRTLSNSRMYPAVISFTDGDPMDEDVREETPRPPLPEVNRAQGRIGLEYSGIFNSGQYGGGSSELGVVFRGDITRINGTYWNLSGYWRGRIGAQSYSGPSTIQNLMSRTYHLTLSYDNPNSKWVMGMGRMYLPWASSLDTIDGGYAGRKLSEHTVAGVFAGSTPDPTSWNYSPHREIAGGFVSFDHGSFEAVHTMTTIGMGVAMEQWSIDRPFVFAENTIAYKQVFSVYDAVQIDSPKAQPYMPAVSMGLKQAFASVRVLPSHRIGLDLNYSYFRDIPTYDPALIGTGLLDKYLFQGLSGGVRVEGPKRLTFYTEVGRSTSSRDSGSSWNTMYGVSLARLWKTGARLDARYSTFNSAFARGSYRSFSISRNLGDILMLQVQAGQQSFNSSFSRDNGSRFLNSMLEWNFGSRYFVDNGFTIQHGATQNYNQFYVTFGYRFDNRSHQRPEALP
ncbi:hypothetical protein Acid345_0470 [Candidatus Koribacter versatilis Ellin345]|uniref:Uncharacterized protein n=1 Tax=Koribacter versatilis (strain Ellin345) TaxID=204669 RepID=Q1IUH5_KORVE|nr:hypothetical protein [Candidatus Koribacter versatilis]ABF39475.1 hypothetical protein Acid345_0470 [Candidatus Koribacter versatilis Ellin345]